MIMMDRLTGWSLVSLCCGTCILSCGCYSPRLLWSFVCYCVQMQVVGLVDLLVCGMCFFLICVTLYEPHFVPVFLQESQNLVAFLHVQHLLEIAA